MTLVDWNQIIAVGTILLIMYLTIVNVSYLIFEIYFREYYNKKHSYWSYYDLINGIKLKEKE